MSSRTRELPPEATHPDTDERPAGAEAALSADGDPPATSAAGSDGANGGSTHPPAGEPATAASEPDGNAGGAWPSLGVSATVTALARAVLARTVAWLVAVGIAAVWAATVFAVTPLEAFLRLSIVLVIEPLYVLVVLFRGATDAGPP